MSMDVATFARQLRRDGVEAARHEADKIVEDARKEAERIKADAEKLAVKLEKEAQANIERQKQRASDEMKLLARDLTAAFRAGIEEAGARLLREKVADNLNDKKIVQEAIKELISSQESGRDWEVALGQKVAKPLADVVVKLLKAKGSKAIIAQELSRAGFEMREADGNEVFEVTEDSVTDSFRKLLSPELRKLLE